MIIEAYTNLAGPCEYDGCDKLAVGEDCFCFTCRYTFCRNHYDSGEHACRYDHINVHKPACDKRGCLRDIDKDAIVARAEQLRPGHRCTVVVPQHEYDVEELLCGTFSIHLTLRYDDGIEWLIRFPGLPFGPKSPEVVKIRLESEVATYRTLRSMGLPVATVHDWGVADFSRSRNPNHTYLVYDKMPGESCEFVGDGDFPEEDSEDGVNVDSDTASGQTSPAMSISDTDDTLIDPEPAEKVNPDHTRDFGSEEAHHSAELQSAEKLEQFIESYAANCKKLSTRTFDAIGSLTVNDAGQTVVGPALDFLTCDRNGPVLPKGPFRSLRDHYLSAIEQILASLAEGLIYRDGLLLPFLTHLELKRFVENNECFATEETEFYLEHPDPHDGNVLFEEGHITALVDWVGTVVTTKNTAFASPAWTRPPGRAIEFSDRELMLCGAYERAGRPDLAACVRGGRLYQVGQALLDTYDYTDSDDVLSTMNNITLMFAPDEGQCQSLGEWGLKALERHSDDAQLKHILQLDSRLERERVPVILKDPEEQMADRWYEPRVRWTPAMFGDML